MSDRDKVDADLLHELRDAARMLQRLAMGASDGDAKWMAANYAATLRKRADHVEELLSAFRLDETRSGSYSEAVAHILIQLTGPVSPSSETGTAAVPGEPRQCPSWCFGADKHGRHAPGCPLAATSGIAPAPPPSEPTHLFYGGIHCIFCQRPREEHDPEAMHPVQRMADAQKATGPAPEPVKPPGETNRQARERIAKELDDMGSVCMTCNGSKMQPDSLSDCFTCGGTGRTQSAAALCAGTASELNSRGLSAAALEAWPAPGPGKPPAKHDWACVAPNGGFYRWECKNVGCGETMKYPSPAGSDFGTPCRAACTPAAEPGKPPPHHEPSFHAEAYRKGCPRCEWLAASERGQAEPVKPPATCALCGLSWTICLCAERGRTPAAGIAPKGAGR